MQILLFDVNVLVGFIGVVSFLVIIINCLMILKIVNFVVVLKAVRFVG